ncbi:MAG: phosphoribosylaminoimidazolesuccinocarboxamide synthase [Myxococcales bacterium]|nr:phosphoribosylaminoimidazolesuccinocarboxamide synthase [Myxococcales bacterium]MCB9531432.1 phosphoribosylaminoimidazolesuccinocarboxamide synthase [Myxococcales bacterium]MCB9534057.1 phosphoribosylaminoimidazolesuccinocarboxamide synthase [Myxococcales bacterium]
MIDRDLIRANLDTCLEDAAQLGLPGYRRGKVRDTFDLGDRLVLVTTDRQSAFDRVLASIPFKGQVLNQVSSFWFDATRDIAPNHVISSPDPNVTVGRKGRVVPVEFVVRSYLTGSTSTSIWKNYAAGVRDYCGHTLPDGLVKNQALERAIVTPTTKDDAHDELTSGEALVDRGVVSRADWTRMEELVLALFERGREHAAKNGLILVDTKYELAWDAEGELMVVDEIHTPDSSRYWIAATYAERFAAGAEPENIDKEFLRLWFVDNCDPYNDPTLPEAPPELVVELSARYIRLYEMITGRDFVPVTSPPVAERLAANLAYLRG